MNAMMRRDRSRNRFLGTAGAVSFVLATLSASAQEGLVPDPDNSKLSWPVMEPVMEPVGSRTLDSGLVIQDIVVGEGPAIEIGTWPSVHYRAMSADKVVFVDSLTKDPPASYEFFFSEVVMEGWVQGLPGLRVGGVRRLIIPGELAYGENPPPNTPVEPGATVIFDFMCISVSTLEDAELGNGVHLRQLREGEGEPARYGDWVTFHMKVFAGEDIEQRVGMNTYEEGIEPRQIALPSPPGQFTGRAMPGFTLPYLDMIIYGMKEGERRDVSFPTSEMFGPMGSPKLGIGANEPFAVEFECLSIDRGPVYELDNGIRMEDVEVGDGRYAHLGEYVHFHYKGTLEDGTVIESNWDDAEPMVIRIFQPTIISGVRYAIQGMQVGGIRRMHIPPNMAFGSAPPDEYSHVPPNATVIYDVKLVDVSYPRPPGRPE